MGDLSLHLAWWNTDARIVLYLTVCKIGYLDHCLSVIRLYRSVLSALSIPLRRREGWGKFADEGNHYLCEIRVPTSMTTPIPLMAKSMLPGLDSLGPQRKKASSVSKESDPGPNDRPSPSGPTPDGNSTRKTPRNSSLSVQATVHSPASTHLSPVIHSGRRRATRSNHPSTTSSSIS